MTSVATSATTKAVKKPSFYIPSLDGIRAIAMFVVVISHTGFGDIVPGRTGVTVFFFLSGFLITTLMMREFEKNGQLDLKKFLARRFIRLAPPVIVFLGAIYVLAWLEYIPGGVSLQGFFYQFFYLANYFEIFLKDTAATPRGTVVLWSLAVEEHFYVLYPIVMIFLFKKYDYKKIINIFLVISVIILAWRMWLASQDTFLKDRNALASDTRFDSILLGCVLALSRVTTGFREAADSAKIKSKELAIIVASLIAFSTTFVISNEFFRETFRYTVQALALIPLFHFAIMKYDSWLFKLLQNKILRKLGIYSYVIYLIHFSLHFLIWGEENHADGRYLKTVVTFGLSIAIAAAYDSLVEPKFTKMRAKLRA